MKLIHFFALNLFCLFAFNVAAKNVTSKKTSSLDLAISAFEKYKSKVTSLSLDCVSFVEDDSSGEESDDDIIILEKHDAKCGGDPTTAPAVAHLRVKGKKVYIMDDVSGDYRLLDKKWKPAQ